MEGRGVIRQAEKAHLPAKTWYGARDLDAVSFYPMPNAVNLADPDVEPTDAELRELSRQAFSGVKAAHEAALERLRAQIAAAREQALRHLGPESAREPT